MDDADEEKERRRKQSIEFMAADMKAMDREDEQAARAPERISDEGTDETLAERQNAQWRGERLRKQERDERERRARLRTTTSPASAGSITLDELKRHRERELAGISSRDVSPDEAKRLRHEHRQRRDQPPLPKNEDYRSNGSGDDLSAPLILRRASTVEPENVRWLWRHFLARRKLHLLAGAPGTGKTTIALTWAAILSRGTVWPGHVDGEDLAPCGDVIIWSAEDSVEDTIVPRLMAAGADLDRIHIIEGRPDPNDATGKKKLPFDPSSQADLDRLGLALTMVEKPIAIILDPIMATMKAGSDSHKSGDVRAGLDPIVQLAEHYDLAAIGITHFSKNSQGHAPIDRVLASVAFTAVPRMVFGCIEVAGKPGLCRITRVKTNIAPVGGGFEYSLCQMFVEHGDKRIEAQRVDWSAEPLVGSPSQLMAVELPADDRQQRQDDAKDWLRDFLLAGPVLQKEIREAVEANGHSWRTIERAKRDLGIEAFREKVPGPWWWRLREPPPGRDPRDDR
jgi:putative DNA primase/helicase